MAEENNSVGLAPPTRLEILGESEQTPADSAMETIAVVVFHGMGQQVKFETLDMLAQALIDAHKAGGGKTAKRARHVWCGDREGGRFFPRVEIELQDAQGNARNVHVYEAYWAPLTEGAISFLSTVGFFLRAGVRGIYTSLKDDRKFLRWAFGREHEFPLAPATFIYLVMGTAALAALVLLLTGGTYWLWPAELRESLLFDTVLKAGPSALLLAATLYVIWKTRRWIVQYLGDVAIYVGANEIDRYWKIRDDIKRECLRVASVVYRAVSRNESKTDFLYKKVVLAGHSLGSVIAYDTLNALVQRDLASNHGTAVNVVGRTKALLTFGSPLDKVAYIFGTQVIGKKIREALAGGTQPLIVNYDYRPAKWINIYAKMDVIAGRLDYFDDPGSGAGGNKRVQNEVDGEASWFPPSAHTDYWTHSVLKQSLYESVTG